MESPFRCENGDAIIGSHETMDKNTSTQEAEKKESDHKPPAKTAKTEKSAPKEKEKKTVRRLIRMIVFLLIAIVVIVVFSGYALLKKTAVPPSTGAEEVATQFENYYGTIEGSLGYPSDFIPEMSVCAVETKTKESYCTMEMLENEKFMYGIGYSLEIPEGSYQIYAQLEDSENTSFKKGYKAYYSKFVTCGMDIKCDSHKPITVKIKGGETLSDIDPQDWYK